MEAAQQSSEPGAGLTLVHQTDNYGTEHAALSWSPDGAWLSFVSAAPNTFDRILLWECGGDSPPIAVTSDRSENSSPTWSADGEWLYFLSDRDLTNIVGSPWGARAPEPQFRRSTKVYGLALKEGLRPPWQLNDELAGDDKQDHEEDHEEEAAEEEGADEAAEESETAGDGEEKKGADKDEKKVEMSGGAAEAALRLYELPIAAGDYSAVLALPKNKLLLRTGGALARVDLEPKKTLEKKNVASGAQAVMLSQDGTKILVRIGGETHVFASDAGAYKPDDASKVDSSAVRVVVSPEQERASMYEDAWRMLRDQFYDPGMHGVDWDAMREKYRPLLPRVQDRRELNDVLMQLTAELCALHHFVRGGDIGREPEAALSAALHPGHLGATLQRVADGFKVVRLYHGDPERPSSLGPLTRPEANVKEGDLLTHINGTPVGAAASPAELLLGRAGQQVRVGVRGDDDERDIIVTPISTMALANLKYTDWEESCRHRVEERGGGEIGYVHLRAMGGENYSEFAAGYFPVWDRAGLIIDVRHNRGGNIDSWVLEKLLRQCWFFWSSRNSKPYLLRQIFLLILSPFRLTDFFDGAGTAACSTPSAGTSSC